jgi:hypothetical protein
MKRIFVLIALMLAIGSYAAAQQNPADAPATKEDIEKYMEVMHSKELMGKTVDAMMKPMHQMLHEEYLKDKDRLPPDFESRMTKIMDDYMKSFPWGEIMDAMVPVYQKHFTKGDVDALVAFYSTPTGQKLVKEMPQITAEAMQSMMPMLQKNMNKMTEQLQEEVTAMLKDHERKNVKASPQINN